MYNSVHIRHLREAIEAMKKHNEVLEGYCTTHCHICPLRDMCNWDGIIDYGDPKITNEVLDRYVDLWKDIKQKGADVL